MVVDHAEDLDLVESGEAAGMSFFMSFHQALLSQREPLDRRRTRSDCHRIPQSVGPGAGSGARPAIAEGIDRGVTATGDRLPVPRALNDAPGRQRSARQAAAWCGAPFSHLSIGIAKISCLPIY